MSSNHFPHLLFTPDLVDQTPDIGRVLAEMMDSQVQEIEMDLAQKFSKDHLRRGLVMKILGSFVTEDDTRQPCARAKLSFPGYPEEAVDYCLERLKATRLLKDYGEGTYELTHDTLARHLAKQRDEETANIIEIVRAVKGAFNTHKFDKKHFLGEFALIHLRKYEEPIRHAKRLNEEEWAFVKESESDVERKKQKQRAWFIGLAILAIVMGIGVISFSTLWRISEQREAQLKKTLTELDAESTKNQNLIGYQEEVTDALQEQKSDRAKSWQLLSGNRFTVEDPSLKSQLKNQLIQEYPVAPFYNLTTSIPGGNEKVIIDHHQGFYCAVMKGYAQVLFKPNDARHKILLTPAGISPFAAVVDIMQAPGTERILTLHRDGKLFLWDSLRHKTEPVLIDSFPVTDGPPTTLVPHPQGALVGAGPRVYMVHLDGQKFPSRFILGFDRPVKTLAVNPVNPNEFAVVKENHNQINICRLDSSAIVNIYDNFKPEYESVTSLAYSPDGKKLFAAFEGDIGILWDIRTPSIHTLFRGHNGFIADAAFSPNGQWLLTGGWDTKMILWDTNGNKMKEMQGHKSRIHCVSFLSDDYTVSVDEEGLINYWYIGILAEAAKKLPNRIRAMAASPAGNLVAYCSYADTVGFFIWDLDKDSTSRWRQPLRRWENSGGISAITFSADGKAVLVGADNNLVSLIHLDDPKAHEDYRSSSRRGIPPTNGITSLDMNDDWIAIGNKQAWLKEDRSGLANNHMALLRKRRDNRHEFKVLPHNSGVNIVKFIPGLDNMVLTGCDDGNVYVWNYLRDTLSIDTLSSHSSRISAIDVTRQSDHSWYVLIGSRDNTASFWVLTRSPESGALNWLNNEILFEDLNGFKNPYAWHASDITDVAFFREKDQLKVLTASSDGSAKLWLMAENRYIREIPTIIRHTAEIRAARFTADGRYIVTGGEDRSVKKWDAVTKAEAQIEKIKGRNPME